MIAVQIRGESAFYTACPASHREKKGKCHETWNETSHIEHGHKRSQGFIL